MKKAQTVVDIWPTTALSSNMSVKHISTNVIGGVPYHALVGWEIDVEMEPQKTTILRSTAMSDVLPGAVILVEDI